MNNFEVSVIIPVYNAAPFLIDSVASALKLPEVREIILVEDGSTDNSYQLCKALLNQDTRVRLYQHEGGRNKGAAESRNLGIQKAKYSFIAFLDSDDFYYEHRFEQSRRILLTDGEIDGVYEVVEMINEGSGNRKLFGILKNLKSENLFQHILRGGYYHTNGLTVRKQFLERLEPFNQICWPHEDVEMWLRMAYYGKLVPSGSKEPVASYRVHGANNITNANRASRMRLWRTVFNYWFSKHIGTVNRFIILKQILKLKLQ